MRELFGFLIIVIVGCLNVIIAAHGSEVESAAQTRINFQGSQRNFCPSTKFRYQQPPDRVNTTQRLREIRDEMKRIATLQTAPLQGYIVTTHDEHQNEFLAPRDERLRFISGFSGSSGQALILEHKAILWTDGRYYIQADSQLDCNWIIMKESSIDDWLVNEFGDNKARIGADPKLIPAFMWNLWEKLLEKTNIKLIAVETNLVDKIWQNNRPEYNNYLAYPLENKFSGKPWQEKVKQVRDQMLLANASALVITALDEIAWLLNIRGHDFPNTYVLRAYVIVEFGKIRLYTPSQKLDRSAEIHLKIDGCYHADCITWVEYSEIFKDLRTYNQVWNSVWLPSACVYSPGASKLIHHCISEEKRLIRPSPIINLKAEKNEVEIMGMRNAHLKDAVAMCDFFAYMEEQIELGAVGWDELQVARVVSSFRLEQNDSKGISFDTIVGYGPHGAIPHYEPTNLTNLPIEKDSTMVLDSGGQYKDGTTDVTRTLHFGEPTQEQREAYTNVLIGQIELTSAIFPHTVRTYQLDVLARNALWKHGLEYSHGTSHGIGHFLCVHESPIALSGHESTPACNSAHLRPGYFLSNEPGYYKEGDFGIRLENIIEVVHADFPNSRGRFLTFRDVSLVPYEPKLIEVEMLTPDQRRWLNNYNKRIREEVGEELKIQLRNKGYWWMMKKTRMIPEYGPVNLNYFHGLSRSSLYQTPILDRISTLRTKV